MFVLFVEIVDGVPARGRDSDDKQPVICGKSPFTSLNDLVLRSHSTRPFETRMYSLESPSTKTGEWYPSSPNFNEAGLFEPRVPSRPQHDPTPGLPVVGALYLPAGYQEKHVVGEVQPHGNTMGQPVQILALGEHNVSGTFVQRNRNHSVTGATVLLGEEIVASRAIWPGPDFG